ncbi:MAG: nitronate monooxygenase family protein [Candidatus Omnitrophota bacterium]
MPDTLQPLMIGDLEIKIPIIQGGMGVKVSTAALAAAVANCGGAGTIASVGLAYGADETKTTYVKASIKALRDEIRQAKKLTQGAVGVNIMVALSNYEDLARTAAEEKTDFIISGAGMPLSLPEYAKGASIKLIPIVSSARAAEIILKTWKRRYDRLPDAIIVEGPMAGGHLGFRLEDLKQDKAEPLEKLVVEVIKAAEEYTGEGRAVVPVIAAGGIFDGKDVARFLTLGAQGVQMATRFVATFECPVPDGFKELYIAAKEEDVVIIDSPVGMPGRAVKTEFVNRIMRGEKIPFQCSYRCLRSCDPQTVPYCIARALCNAVIGDLDSSVVFAGSNVAKVKKIVSVKELMDEIVRETIEELHKK